MTRATLLHVLDHPTALGPAEVRELEQLAQAFPYCQTAHLLLAKAAHDQGTMLAGQRLRRAATYAADRTLLRRLIEQVDLPASVEELPIAEALPPTAPADAPIAWATSAAAPAADEAIATPTTVAVAAPVPAGPVLAEAAEAIAATAPAAEAHVVVPLAPATEEVAAPAATTEATFSPFSPGAEPVGLVPVAEAQPVAVPAQPLCTIDAGAAGLPDQENAILEAFTEVETSVEALPAAAAESEVEPDLPAQAPAIRPPVEASEARFEFGLAEPPPPAVNTAYELPGLVDEWAASAVTRGMGGPPAPDARTPTAALAGPVAAVFTPAAFTGDTAVGYNLGESSRLGFSLQLLILLGTRAETAETDFLPATAAQPPATPLPPVGAFFEPDSLLLDHWAAHRPAAPALPSSLDLINNFLRRQPRLTRPAMLPPSPNAQADLSVRSTRAEPDLASESLARILVRQGKTARAIEIYEKLMVKQPEKMAYFVAQIQQLQPPASSAI